jgi:AcrR family transcriptional regulator
MVLDVPHMDSIEDDNPINTRKQRGRPKLVSDVTQRKAIIFGAWRLFIEGGYRNFTTDEVAARCKISKRTLYKLFSSKADLFVAIVDAHRQSMLALPGEYDDLPLEEALERIFKIDSDANSYRERIAFLRFAIGEAVQFPELDAILREHGADKSLSLLAEWLDRQRARVDIDNVYSAAKMLMDMIFGAVVVKAGGELEWPADEDRRLHMRRCIHVFLNGVRRNQTTPSR